MEEQRHQVGGRTSELVPQDSDNNNNPLSRVFKFLNRNNNQTTELEPTQKIIEFFDHDDIQGKLLILGEPGAGKTTELVNLAQDLIQRAGENENEPIPIIFELSAWKNDQPIRDWLIEQLCDIYKGIPKAVAEKWIDNQQIIPLLDGLDESGLNKCIIAINKFLDSNFLPTVPTVLMIGIIKGWMVGLSYVININLFFWLTYGMINVLICGSLAVIQHLILRLFLKGNGDIPWDYAKFLDHAVKHRFIQRVGGRYRFMHDLLRKHFAQMPLN